MSPRSIRRAAERKAAKLARKSATAALITHPLRIKRPRFPSINQRSCLAANQARLAANQTNAQHSTGPKTEKGKAKSRLNAVKIGLTGRTVLLPTDDVEVCNRHVQTFIDEDEPVGPRESELVQVLADHFWRLNRIASLEHALYAYGFEQFSEQFADRGNMQASFTQMHTFLHYEKQFRNLQTQEMRICRNREKDTAELRRIQDVRQTKERFVAREKAAQAAQITQPAPGIGFEFSDSPSHGEEVEWSGMDLATAFDPIDFDSDSFAASAAAFRRASNPP